MKVLFRLCAVCLLLALPLSAHAQLTGSKVTKIEIQHLGPASVGDELIRANIRVKPGDSYLPAAVDDEDRKSVV